ncbi:hypothetical protein B0H10DRAFT_1958521 [Mycena sp. CBHHK59/15]|nr:hypothetical protein B0H10DRAFT_1958521 [Mycena sp. CBHHK59/15]
MFFHISISSHSQKYDSTSPKFKPPHFRNVLGIQPVEQRRRVFSVGSALLQLVTIQHELREELDLNGNTFLDLLDQSIIPWEFNGSDALEAMFLATNPVELKHRKGWDLNRLTRHMLQFNAAHAMYDTSLRSLTFKRASPSLPHYPNEPILFDVPETATTKTVLPAMA